MSVKLKDIAAEAGVSISTVSRILSGDTSRKSNKQTIDKVKKIANDLGYFEKKATILSSQLKSSINIGCIFTSDHESFVSPFFSMIMSGIQEELNENIYNFDCHFFTFNLNETSLYSSLNDINLDGAIILGRTNIDTIEELKKRIPNLVYCGINPMDKGIDEVFCSAYEGVLCEIEYLKNLNHSKIGYIGPTDKQDSVFNEHRYSGYLDGLSKYNLEINQNFIRDSYLSALDGYNSMMDMNSEGDLPSAIICANDIVAMGVLKALHELKILVPENISVLGFDNVQEASFTSPSLSTIDVPKFELGKISVKVLFDRIRKGHKSQLKVQVPFSLVERESCVGVK